MPRNAPEIEVSRQRIDKWLWHARILRTRSAAAALVAGGLVRVNGSRVVAPGHTVKSGDVLTIALDGGVRVLRVTGFLVRRGAARPARDIYDAIEGIGGPGGAF